MNGICQRDHSEIIAGNDNWAVQQTMLYFKCVDIFRNRLYPNRSVRDALRILLF